MFRYKLGPKFLRSSSKIPTTMRGRSALILTIFASISLAAALETRITNGHDAKEEGQFPYQAILRSTTGYLCGGSIIDENWILTAAHCFIDDIPKNLIVTVGTISLNSGTDYGVDKIIAHSEFNMSDPMPKYDIALLRLEKNIKFFDKVNKIDLESEVVGEVDCVVSGFGSTEHIFQKPSEKLQYLNTKVVTGWLCSFSGGDESRLCTQGPLFSSGCSGDSGGPLVAGGKQIGIVSYGESLCAGILPTIYTRVSYYLDWIKLTMRSHD
ncbi:Trypsin [Popillia japonica]|uniref:Trypsin n=1 Tax=Popillia japonica TaxID=7064 RepID=A0AAW1NJ17_POPJA